jgi:EmrB/QacA subfamily drug resistance transporter
MRTQRWTLVVVCAATAMLMLDIAVVNTALSRIAEDLQTGLSGLQWVIDAYTLALASTVLSAGFLADRLGRRKLFTIGLALFTTASLACGLAQDIAMLNGARAVQGIGAAIMFAVSLALLAHAFPTAKERAGAFAVYGATIGAAFAVGPLVGGLLTSGLDWQWIFLVNLPIGAYCMYLTRRYVEESRDPSSHGIDWPGQITLSAGLLLLVLALLRGNEQGWTSTPILAELAGAAVALAAFVAVEARVKAPMLPLRFFRDRSFTGAQLGAFAISASFFAAFIYTTLYLQQILGMSAIDAGLVYLPGTLVMLVVSGATAQLAARVPARTIISAGLALITVGMLLFTLADEHSSWWALMPGLLVACVGTGLFNPAMSNVALSVLPAQQSGVAAGTNDTFRQAGIAVGVAALGALIPAENALGGGSAADYVDGFHNALYAGAGLAAVGAIGAGLLISRRFGTAADAPREQPSIPIVAELSEPLRFGERVGAEA